MPVVTGVVNKPLFLSSLATRVISSSEAVSFRADPPMSVKAAW